MSEVSEHYLAVRERVARACEAAGRSPDEVTLIAVSKKQPVERVLAAYQLGQRDFGESYVQELETRQAALPGDVRWHFIGHLQRNKAAKVVGCAAIHTIDSARLAEHLARQVEAPAPAQDQAASQVQTRRPRVLIQVNISADPHKHGLAPADVPALVRAVAGMGALELVGLMCIPAASAEPRREFARLRTLRDRVAADTGCPLPELSMGMSGDFEAAIAEGATLIRVGTAVFGPRAG